MVVVMAGVPAFAQTTAGTSKPAAPAKKDTAAAAMPADHQFVQDVVMDGMAEVELGQLAQQKAASADVKQFAQRMVTDHGKANDELKSVASTKQITLTTSVDAKHKATYDRLAKLSGSAFDSAYMQAMVTGHQQAVQAFRHEATTGRDADIKSWASKTLPTIEDHLKSAQSTSHTVATSGATKPAAKGTTGH
jgi:putative membrane protein